MKRMMIQTKRDLMKGAEEVQLALLLFKAEGEVVEDRLIARRKMFQKAT